MKMPDAKESGRDRFRRRVFVVP